MLAERGYAVAIIDVQDAEEVVKAIESSRGAAMSFIGSVDDDAAVKMFARMVVDRFGTHRRTGE